MRVRLLEETKPQQPEKEASADYALFLRLLADCCSPEGEDSAAEMRSLFEHFDKRVGSYLSPRCEEERPGQRGETLAETCGVFARTQGCCLEKS